MALTVTGVDANGRITPKGVNVVIPKQSAGIGDIVIMNSSRDVKVIGWGTYNASQLPSGYVAYGVIYGFVNGMARIVALSETSRRWTMAASDSGDPAVTSDSNVDGGYPVAETTVGGGNNVMRNGIKTTYAGMNLNSLMQNSYAGVNTNVHPNTADTWSTTGIMNKSLFDALPMSGGNAKTLYGTWENYVRQTLAIRNPGSCFAVHDSTHKVHEQGRWNTYLLGQYTKASPDANAQGGTPCWYPAANYCYNFYVAGAGETADSHNWWLPSMDEMLDLMTDAHWDKVNTCGATALSNRAGRWSSVRYSSVYAWYYYTYGFALSNGVRNALAVRAVSLLKL